MRYRLLPAALIIIAVLVAMLPVSSVFADEFIWFTSASSSCTDGTYSYQVNQILAPELIQFPQSKSAFKVEAWDSADNFLGSDSFDPWIGAKTRTISYASTPVGDVTFYMYAPAFGAPQGPAAAEGNGFWHLVDSITVTPDCDSPGCDQFMKIPATAVVGQFNDDAALYWQPGALIQPETVLAAGQTAWVLGVDATGAYTQIIWVCDYVWVPTGSIGPNYDDVWNGAPLPTGVVE